MNLKLKILIVLFTISILNSCNSKIQGVDIEGKWKVDSVEKMSDGTISPDMGIYFTFKSDSTLVSESAELGFQEAHWTIFDDKIKMIENEDTTNIKIEDLHENEMVLIIDLGKGGIKLNLSKQ